MTNKIIDYIIYFMAILMFVLIASGMICFAFWGIVEVLQIAILFPLIFMIIAVTLHEFKS